jgi:hypothetical protein
MGLQAVHGDRLPILLVWGTLGHGKRAGCYSWLQRCSWSDPMDSFTYSSSMQYLQGAVLSNGPCDTHSYCQRCYCNSTVSLTHARMTPGA